MVQPRIDQLVEAIAASEMATNRRGGEDDAEINTEPFRVALVGDSTMMMQSGVICAFLAERPGRRFDPQASDVMVTRRQVKLGTRRVAVEVRFCAILVLERMHYNC